MRARNFFFIWWIWWRWFIDFITIFIFVLIVFYLIISLVFIMILAWNKLNTVINSKRSLSHESILAKRLIFFALLVPFSSPEGLFPLIVSSVYTQMLRICANPTKKVLLRSYDKGFVDGCSFKLLTTRYYSGCIEKVVLRSSSQGDCKLDPNWVTGFVDGEGCFHVSIPQRKDRKPGWGVQPGFTIVLHKKDKPLLDRIKNFLGVGRLTKQGSIAIQFRVWSIKELKIIMKFFKKYYLLTKKWADFEFWCKILELIERGEHLTLEGLRLIVALKASMNQGL